MTSLNRSYGGSSLTYRTRTLDATVSLKALVDGLRVEVEDHDGVAACQLIQWDQVDAWMEAAEVGELEELIQTSQRDWAVRERARRALKGK